MTYSFDPSMTTDVDIVRFKIGDNHDEGHFLDNETIQYYITNGSVGSAVIACIEYIITQLSTPDFKQDWNSVTFANARAGYEALLKRMRQEYGISSITATSTIKNAHRADSYENVDGVYTAPDGLP
ncbi:MAG: hypothetical protein WC455_25710 [Dehalococcoidia bacterium]